MSNETCLICNKGGGKDKKYVVCDRGWCNKFHHKKCMGIDNITEANLRKLNFTCLSCVEDYEKRREQSLIRHDMVKVEIEECAKSWKKSDKEVKELAQSYLDQSIDKIMPDQIGLIRYLRKELEEMRKKQNVDETIDRLNALVAESTRSTLQLQNSISKIESTVHTHATLPPQGKVSYASMVKDTKEKNVLKIFMEDNEKLNDAKKNEIKAATSKVQIENTRFFDSHCTMVFASDKERENAEKEIKGKITGLTLNKVGKWKPRIIIKKVDQDDSNDLLNVIANKNDWLDVDKMKEISKWQRGRNRADCVLECDPETRKKIASHGDKLSLTWEVIEIDDYIKPTVCFKCQGYAHIAKKCTKSYDTCRYCGDQHKTRECPVKDSSDYKCPVCVRHNRGNPKHLAHTDECPCYKSEIKRVIERIDHGS